MARWPLFYDSPLPETQAESYAEVVCANCGYTEALRLSEGRFVCRDEVACAIDAANPPSWYPKDEER